MKKMMLFIVILLSLVEPTMAQNKRNKNTVKKSNADRNNTTHKPQKQKDTVVKKNITYTLTSTSTNNAFANRQSATRFSIADPIIGALNAKANGNDVKISSSGIVGVPKGTYGFAHGKIIFYPSGATSSGTSTGSGSVGTGTGPGGISMFGPAIGVNGKSPFTGTGAYGVRIPLVVETTSDTSRSTGVRRN
jgi:hypothetical protein